MPMTPLSPEAVANVIAKLRRYLDGSYMAYLICEIADMLPIAERNEWHKRCKPGASRGPLVVDCLNPAAREAGWAVAFCKCSACEALRGR